MNIMTRSLNLSELFQDVQQKLEQNIAHLLEDVRSEHNEYKELHDNIMSLPFVAKLVEENKMLKKKLEQYETKRISLEVQEKPLPAREPDKFVYTDDGETMLLAKNAIVASTDAVQEESEEEEASVEEDSDEEEEEEEQASAEEEEEQEEEEASAEEKEDTVEQEQEQEQEEEEGSAEEEEEEASADEEDASAEEEEEDASAEEDEEVEEIMIAKKMYYTTNAQNGYIYADDDGDVGEVVGKFVNGEAMFD